MRRERVRVARVLIAALCVGSCGRDESGDAMSISPASAEVAAGSAPLTLTVLGAGFAAAVNWSLDGPGTISPINELSASFSPPASVASRITATVVAISSSGRRATSILTIRPPTDAEVTLSVSPTSASAFAGGPPVELTASVLGAPAVVRWSLVGAGMLSTTTGLSTGYRPPDTAPGGTSATVTATLSSPLRTASATIAIAVTGDGVLRVSPSSASVYSGGLAIAFTASVTGSTGTVSWSLAGPGTLSVMGPLSASYLPPQSVASDATAVLTAVLSNPSRRVSANITVRRPLGNLTVDVSVPPGSGLVPTIVVNGPGGFTRTLSSTQTLSSVPAGTYSVSTRTEIVAGPIATSVYPATTTGAPAVVLPGGSTAVSVRYSLRPGSGHLWVADAYGLRLRAYAASQLASSGTVAASISIAPPNGAPMSTVIAANGDLWAVLDPFTIGKYSSGSLVSGSRAPDVTLGSGGRGGFLEFVSGLAFDPSGSLWLASGEAHRQLLKYSASRLASSATNPVPDVTIGSPVYWYPTALAFDAAGNLWAADAQNNKLLRYNRDQLGQGGTPAPAVTLSNSAPDVPLSFPIDLAFDLAGNLWVSNLAPFSPPPTLIMYTATQAAAGGVPNPAVTIPRSGLTRPRGMAFDASGGLWIGISQGLARYSPSQLASSGDPIPQTLIQDAAINTPMALAFDPPSAGTPLFR